MIIMKKTLTIGFLFLLSSNAYLCFARENVDPVEHYSLQFDGAVNQGTAEGAESGETESRVTKSEDGTEATAPCWDCYEKRTWTKVLREELGKLLPASFRTEDDETVKGKAINCAGGGFQVVTDLAAGAVVLVGSSVAYVIEPVAAGATKAVNLSDQKIINLGKHRIDQAEYAFWYVAEGNLVKVGYEAIEGLVSHIAKAIKDKDTYAICESVGAITATLLAPEARLAYLKDKRTRVDAHQAQNAPLKTQLSEELKILEEKTLPDLGTKQQKLLREKAELEQQLAANQAELKNPNLSKGERNEVKAEMQRIGTKIKQREENIGSVQKDIETAYTQKAQIAKVLASSETLRQSTRRAITQSGLLPVYFLSSTMRQSYKVFEGIKDIIPVDWTAPQKLDRFW